MEYMSITQAAEKWGITPLRIQALCKEERVPGSIRIGYVWVIPADAEKLKDARVRSGKYVKAMQEKRGYNKKRENSCVADLWRSNFRIWSTPWTEGSYQCRRSIALWKIKIAVRIRPFCVSLINGSDKWIYCGRQYWQICYSVWVDLEGSERIAGLRRNRGNTNRLFMWEH